MSRVVSGAVKVARGIDDRTNAAKFARSVVNKVFPDHWSFLLGEIALYSFAMLLLSGTYLTFFFNDSMTETTYHGSYVPLDGATVSEAYESVVDLSMDVRAGLFVRQMHHWAANIFVAAIIVHMARIFFTGAYRKPREANWVVGVVMLTLAMVEGFCGYSLPDDLLSGTGLRIGYSIVQSIPIVGTWVSFLMFGGEWPGHVIIQRLYLAHVLLIPGLLLALIGVHLALVWHQKHTQFKQPGRTESNVVGSRMLPSFTSHSISLSIFVFAVLAALGGLAQINPVFEYGPYEPSDASSFSQPDWYIGFLEGALRVWPPWDIRIGGITISNVFWPAVFLPVVLISLAALWPWIERFITRDKAYHHLLERPRDNPWRTGIGAMAFTFYGVLFLAGGDDVWTYVFHLNIEAAVWGLRFATILLPPAAYLLARYLASRLQARDRVNRVRQATVLVASPDGHYDVVAVPTEPAVPPELSKTDDRNRPPTPEEMAAEAAGSNN